MSNRGTSGSDDSGMASRTPGPTLRVVVEDEVSRYRLPERGEVTLGRGSDIEVHIARRDVSRRHARIRVDDQALFAQDAGSANGSRHCGRPLPADSWTELQSGDWLGLGDALVVVDVEGDRAPSRSIGRDAFVSTLETRIELNAGAPLTVLTLRSVTSRRWIDVVEAMLRTEDHLGVVGDALVSVVLHAGVERARAMGEALRRHLRNFGVQLEVKLRAYPADGRTADELAPPRRPTADRERTTSPPHAPLVNSPAMRALYELVDEVAPSRVNVLLLGETGVGKEVVARTLHERSQRRDGPMLAINCAAITDNLLEGELFGYERGAFTGAVTAKPGLLEVAEGGTVLLDEIGEMPLTTQAKLLRVLEERKVWRLGRVEPRDIDVRILAATNADLHVAVQEGRFRADLFYRINGVQLAIPPLRERTEEIEPLARRFARRAASELERAQPTWSPEALAKLMAYDWPGNVRELRNAVERAVLLAREGQVEVSHLPDELRADTLPSPVSEAVTTPPEPPSTLPSEDLMTEVEQLERDRIVAALDACHGNQTRAAKELGITRRMLISRLDRYAIPRPRKKP